LRIHFDIKMSWATFWAACLQTHLVTLLDAPKVNN
jgi:hypothetical protein